MAVVYTIKTLEIAGKFPSGSRDCVRVVSIIAQQYVHIKHIGPDRLIEAGRYGG
jgi:hypothetical protein